MRTTFYRQCGFGHTACSYTMTNRWSRLTQAYHVIIWFYHRDHAIIAIKIIFSQVGPTWWCDGIISFIQSGQFCVTGSSGRCCGPCPFKRHQERLHTLKQHPYVASLQCPQNRTVKSNRQVVSEKSTPCITDLMDETGHSTEGNSRPLVREEEGSTLRSIELWQFHSTLRGLSKDSTRSFWLTRSVPLPQHSVANYEWLTNDARLSRLGHDSKSGWFDIYELWSMQRNVTKFWGVSRCLSFPCLVVREHQEAPVIIDWCLQFFEFVVHELVQLSPQVCKVTKCLWLGHLLGAPGTWDQGN